MEAPHSPVVTNSDEDVDRELIRRLRSESKDSREQAASDLVAKYGPMLRALLHAALRHDLSWDLREEVVLSALRKAMANLHRFKSTGGRHGFRNWLWTIARNLARDVLKSGQHRQRCSQHSVASDDALDDFPAREERPPDFDQWAAERAAIDRAVERMTGRNREYADLFLGFPSEEDRPYIAQRMGIKADNERQIRGRMLSQLRELLLEDGFEWTGGATRERR